MPQNNLPHVTNSTAGVNKYEPVVASNFNVLFVTMGSLRDIVGDFLFLSEYVKSVSGLFIEYSGNTVEAGFKTTKFRYDSNDKQTFYDIEVQFHNFLTTESIMLVYNSFVMWSRVKYNPLTGQKSLKSVYANACIVAEKFNRDGTVYWRRIANNVFPINDFPDQMLDYQTHEMTEFSVTFNADWVTDVTNDPRLVTI